MTEKETEIIKEIISALQKLIEEEKPYYIIIRNGKTEETYCISDNENGGCKTWQFKTYTEAKEKAEKIIKEYGCNSYRIANIKNDKPWDYCTFWGEDFIGVVNERKY